MILKKRKLKLRKRVWAFFVIILFLGLGFYTGNKIHQNNLYKKTSEYKLLQVGYSLQEIDFLESNLEKDFIESLYNSSKNDFLLSLLKEKYYLKKNLSRYLKFKDSNKDYSSYDVVSLVNTQNDYKYYDHDIDTDITKDYLLLVNKFYF